MESFFFFSFDNDNSVTLHNKNISKQEFCCKALLSIVHSRTAGSQRTLEVTVGRHNDEQSTVAQYMVRALAVKGFTACSLLCEEGIWVLVVFLLPSFEA